MEGRGSKIPSNVEQLTDLNLRAARWWNNNILAFAESLRDDPAHREAAHPIDVLVVSHGGYISRLIANMLRSGKMRCAEGVLVDGKCGNASVSAIDMLENGEAVLVSYSDTTHLKVKLVQANADVLDQ